MPPPLRHLRQVAHDDELLPVKSPTPDWASQTADSIEKVVVTLRSKTADPLERIVRIVVYGVLAAALGMTALVLLLAALVRAVDIAIPGEVWSAHLAIGGIFTLLGLFLWAKRRRPSGEDA
jgi:hypothetical protein